MPDLNDLLPLLGLIAVNGAFAGLIAGLLGIGGGSFGVPPMTLYGVPIHRAVATAAGFGAVNAAPSVAGFLLVQGAGALRPPFTLGQVNLVAFAVVVVMTFLTAPLGARISHATDPKPLRRIFAIFVTVMALNMLRKAFVG